MQFQHKWILKIIKSVLLHPVQTTTIISPLLRATKREVTFHLPVVMSQLQRMLIIRRRHQKAPTHRVAQA